MVCGKTAFVHIESTFWMRAQQIWDVIWKVSVRLSIGHFGAEETCSFIVIRSITHPHFLLSSHFSNLFSSSQGISRSASITIAYLIHNHGMSFETAHGMVKRKRACIKPNSGFLRVLQEWDIACHSSGRGGGPAQNMRPVLGRRFTS